jgi:hypothetical protein
MAGEKNDKSLCLQCVMSGVALAPAGTRNQQFAGINIA